MDHRIVPALGAAVLGSALLFSLAGAEEPTTQATEAEKAGVEKKAQAVEVPQVDPTKAEAGAAAFADVAKVLLSPRCMNCHPAGNAPLQTDESVPHKMNITRKSFESGLKCSTCHQEQNSEALGIKGGPPGAPNWHLPPKETPMVFEGRTPSQLCKQLKNPAQNGNKSLDQLLHHVTEDALVLWGWNPGGDRTKPPLAHDEFVTVFKTWVDSGGACP